MNNSNNAVLVFVAIAAIAFSMLFGSCGGGVSDDIARHAIDRAALVRTVDEIANGGK